MMAGMIAVDNFQKYPGSWINAKENPPEGEGLFVTLYKEREEDFIVHLMAYGEYLAWNDEKEGYETCHGWYDCASGEYGEFVTRNVVAYLPQNYDMESLVSVRDFLKGEKQ